MYVLICVYTGCRRRRRMCPLRHTTALQDYILLQEWIQKRWDIEKKFGLGSRSASFTQTQTHMYRQINTQNTHTKCVYVFTYMHKQFGSLWPWHTERLWLDSPAFYSMLLTLLTDTHKSGHRLQQNTKPQAVIEADWPAPLYFQSIYSVQPSLYISIMCSASFPKRMGDRVCEQAAEKRPFQSLWGFTIITWLLSFRQNHSGHFGPVSFFA